MRTTTAATNTNPLRESTQEEAFWKFHASNPQVFTTLVRLTKEWVALGHKTVGMSMIYEAARYQLGLLNPPGATTTTAGGTVTGRYVHADGNSTRDETIKLNNNYRAYYARLIMAQHPELDGIFSVREQRQLSSIDAESDLFPEVQRAGINAEELAAA